MKIRQRLEPLHPDCPAEVRIGVFNGAWLIVITDPAAEESFEVQRRVMRPNLISAQSLAARLARTIKES